MATPEQGPFYGISGFWCWITPNYPTERYTLEYLFMFTTAGVSFVLYSLIFFRLRGNIAVNGWKVSFRRRFRFTGPKDNRYHAITDPCRTAKS